MDIILDSRTLTFALATVNAVIALLMLLFWLTRKIYRGFGAWTAVFLCMSVAFALLGLRGHLPDILSVTVPNLLQSCSAVLIAEGIGQFFDKPRSRLNYILLVLIMAGVGFFQYVIASTAARIVVIALGWVLIYTRCGIDLFAHAPRDMRTEARFVGAVLIGFGLLNLVRGTAAAFGHVPDDIFAIASGQSLSFAFGVAFTIVLAFGFFSLTTERIELELRAAEAELRRLASTDYLTNTFNLRQFTERGHQVFEQARLRRESISLLMLDIDRFKQVNDTFGHAFGDRVIQAVARTLQLNVRTTDFLARLGGDEFAVLLPRTDADVCILIAERLRLAALDLLVQYAEHQARVTVSIGLTVVSSEDACVDAMLQRADAALYVAKGRGGNSIAAQLAGQRQLPQHSVRAPVR